MTVTVNGIAHIQLTVRNPDVALPFWEVFLNFLDMATLVRNADTVYCIGSRTGVLVRAAPPHKRDSAFDQWTSGLHHFCFRARERDDVDRIFRHLAADDRVTIVHGPEEGDHFAPGYYSLLFEDPDGIRVEVNHVPGKGHFGDGGRLGPGGPGTADAYGKDGIGDREGNGL